MQVVNSISLDSSSVLLQAPTYPLLDILLSYKKDRLNKLASYYKVPKRSTLKKAELAEAIAMVLTDTALLFDLVQAYSDEERQLFDQLLTQSHIDSSIGSVKNTLEEQGILHEVTNGQQSFYVLPTEIKKAWYKGDFHLESENTVEIVPTNNSQEATLLVYLKALRNLYGAYPKQLLIDIYQQHQQEVITIEQLNEFFPVVADGLELVEKDDYYLSDLLAENNFEGLALLLKSMYNKTYYIPTINEVMNYQDKNYYAITPAHKQLATTLILNFNINKKEAFDLVEDLDFHFRQGFSLDKSVYYFKSRNIIFDSPSQSVEIRDLTIALNNNCRMWFNGGHTPSELINKGFKPVKYTYYLAHNSGNNPAKSQKIDRNSPCPCGSGKKYKKCCL